MEHFARYMRPRDKWLSLAVILFAIFIALASLFVTIFEDSVLIQRALSSLNETVTGIDEAPNLDRAAIIIGVLNALLFGLAFMFLLLSADSARSPKYIKVLIDRFLTRDIPAELKAIEFGEISAIEQHSKLEDYAEKNRVQIKHVKGSNLTIHQFLWSIGAAAAGR